MRTIRADELEPGDVVLYGGHRRCITRVDHRAGWAWPVAVDGTGWAMALHRGLVTVVRAAS